MEPEHRYAHLQSFQPCTWACMYSRVHMYTCVYTRVHMCPCRVYTCVHMCPCHVCTHCTCAPVMCVLVCTCAHHVYTHVPMCPCHVCTRVHMSLPRGALTCMCTHFPSSPILNSGWWWHQPRVPQPNTQTSLVSPFFPSSPSRSLTMVSQCLNISQSHLLPVLPHPHPSSVQSPLHSPSTQWQPE